MSITREDIVEATKTLSEALIPDGMTKEAFDMFNNLEIEMMENTLLHQDEEYFDCEDEDVEGIYKFETESENAWLKHAENIGWMDKFEEEEILY